MIIHQGYDHLELKEPVVTIGTFDGVHRGHRYLLGRLTEKAHECGGQSVVITFDPHPRMVVEKERGEIFFLSTLTEKIKLLEAAGIDHLVIINFTPGFSRLKACDFVNDILIKKIGTKHLVIGHDHRFGSGGEGNADTIQECAGRAGIEILQVPGLDIDGRIVSSSLIRGFLLSGEPEKADLMLGYTYSLKGTIVSGKKIGRDIGFPTANISVDDPMKLIPANGVYAVEVKKGGAVYKGMLNIGINPTVSGEASRSIEVNIFDFSETIYGDEIEVFIRFWLRHEKKFGSLDELISQLHNDREKAMKLLS